MLKVYEMNLTEEVIVISSLSKNSSLNNHNLNFDYQIIVTFSLVLLSMTELHKH